VLGLEWSSLKAAATVALLTAVLGGLFPALRAARLKPVEALRHT
jgi:ABC-type antimicrobial peptide transport system permease subunit